MNGQRMSYSSALIWRLAKPASNGSVRPLYTGRRLLNSDKNAQPAEPPLKFSESAAYAPRSERPVTVPSVGGLRFWEDVTAKRGHYLLMNRISFLVSITAFMVYFAILREENDLDEELTKPLWQRLPSLEEKVLHERIMLGKNRGDDVSEYEKRYSELLNTKQEEQQRLFRKK